MKYVIQLATKTNNNKDRATDDLRSLVQSIILSTLPSSEQRQPNQSIPSNREVATVLGMISHQYQRIALSLKTKRGALEERTSGSVFIQVIQRKGWRRVNEDLK